VSRLLVDGGSLVYKDGRTSDASGSVVRNHIGKGAGLDIDDGSDPGVGDVVVVQVVEESITIHQALELVGDDDAGKKLSECAVASSWPTSSGKTADLGIALVAWSTPPGSAEASSAEIAESPPVSCSKVVKRESPNPAHMSLYFKAPFSRWMFKKK
jgi:hypothetical protein